jgi:hypothetical protein
MFLVDEGALADNSLDNLQEKWGPQAFAQFQENFPNGILGHTLMPYPRAHHVEGLPGLPREFYEIPAFLERQGYEFSKEHGWSQQSLNSGRNKAHRTIYF